uniref:Proteasome subunit beta n=1 Tax=Neolamprologus brichardi TaxID=32507 RepID=A0A3Q4HSC0_NEOBR
MALEDVCSFKERPVQHKWFSFSSLGDAAIPFPKSDYYNLRLETSENNCGVPLHFFIPPLPHSSSFINRPLSSFCPPKNSMTVQRPFRLAHGTTTLGFIFQGGVIAAADTRASAGGLVACPAVHKITPIHSHLVVTSSGSGADCMLWERILIREIRLYQLRHGHRLSIRATAKLLSSMLHPFKGTEMCVALTLCGWDNGPKLIYVCSDGARLQGDVFSVGSGSPYAYGVLDRELRWSLSKGEAISLAREAVFRATHRDAYSGNNVDLFHITAQGWIHIALHHIMLAVKMCDLSLLCHYYVQ